MSKKKEITFFYGRDTYFPVFTRGLTFFLLLFLFLPLCAFPEPLYHPDATDRDIQIYLQAVREIEKKALHSQSRGEIIRESLRSYLKNTDELSAYLSPAEYAAFQKSQSGQYVGLGMEIEKKSSGQFICFPYPGSPADKAGIRSGDILEALAGENVSDQSVFQIAAKAMGEKGTEISVKIRNSEKKSRIVQVIRDEIVSESLQSRKEQGLTVIRIFYFGGATVRELKFALTEIKDGSPFIIDLRKNPGGDLHAAIDSAMLFLEKGNKIIDIRSRDDVRSYYNTTIPLNSSSPLYICQDEHTASAAEVFIAALVQNRRAESVGKKTFGKGVQQDIIELADGSALFLTTAWLQTPDGTLYHGQGIEPGHMIQEPSADTAAYMKKIRFLMNPETVKIEQSVLPAKNRMDDGRAESMDKKTVRDTGKSSSVSGSGVSPESSEKKAASYSYFTCFSKEFDTEEEAEIWSSTVMNSLNEPDEQYLLQENRGGSIKYIVCLGIYENKEKAQQKRERISRLMKADMFIKSLKQEKNR
ncbi:MAG: S41 family peptidase [Desulfococcaceae bacterium]|jgi:carboxyl-terminal processing protease|nr:S41 family peptidase [Desulfococcaceae bacterium]